MNAEHAQQQAYVSAAARTLGLDIAPWADGVHRYFALAARMAAVVEACPLDRHDEPLETFVPAWPTADPRA